MKRRWIAAGVLVAGAVIVALVCAEGLLRLLDGYQLRSVALRGAAAAAVVLPPPANSADLRYVSQIPVAQGVDRAWYAREPAGRQRLPVDGELERRAAQYPADTITPFFSFNRRYLQREVCGGLRAGELAHFEDFFYFDPTEPSPYPSFRHLRHVSPPGWFVTNNFGWRGLDVALNRPPNLIRIAFVGASTTIDSFGAAFSHPELVELGLNEWAAAGARPYRFEVINAGRSGIDSSSIAAVVRQELVPVDPDLVVFYEGANQFWPGQVMHAPLGRLFRAPATTFRQRLKAENYSVLVRRALTVVDRFTGGDGGEPLKPPYTVDWPVGLDERNPDLAAPILPMDLKQVVSDLDSMRQALGPSGGELAVASFIWLVHDGLRLDMKRHLPIFRYLNDAYWPITYAHMRRMADFQNRVFETYARTHGIPFLDIAGRFPQDPDLFDDAIHLKYRGLKLQAWVFMQSLIPVILDRTASGRWPRPVGPPRAVHPAFDQPDRRLITLAELKGRCS